MTVDCPTRKKGTFTVLHDGRKFCLSLGKEGWRLRSRTKRGTIDFCTGTGNRKEAADRAKEWLDRRANDPMQSKRGGGTIEALAAAYMTAAKRTKDAVAGINISRLRTVCRVALGKELSEVTCKEVGPQLWESYQRAALKKAGREFNLNTRYRENIAINSAVRAARCLFLKPLLRVYQAAGLTVNGDCADAVQLPVPYVPPSPVDDRSLVRAWIQLRKTDLSLWLVVGLARFAGLRREEISALRCGWVKGGVIDLRDRPEDGFWTKTGKPYSAMVIGRRLRAYLAEVAKGAPGVYVVPDPLEDRRRWFERAPQAWLQAQGVTAAKPLHRLRGLYANHIARVAEVAIAAKLGGIKAAQKNLGHTSSHTTEQHYLSL